MAKEQFYDVALEIGQYAGSPQEAVKMFMDMVKSEPLEEWSYTIRQNEKVLQYVDGRDAEEWDAKQEFTVTFNISGTRSELQEKIRYAQTDGWDLIEAFDEGGNNI